MEDQPNNIKNNSGPNKRQQEFYVVLVEVVQKKYGQYSKDAQQTQEVVFGEHKDQLP
jgi:heat shock protein HspQ